MHFQYPPYDHNKLVYVSQGSIVDVVVDLRKNSDSYLKVFSVELSSKNNLGIYIPKGFAHGFKTLEDNSIVTYFVDSVYNKKNDNGLLYNSINYDWNLKSPIISKRDLSLVSLEKFESPFL